MNEIEVTKCILSNLVGMVEYCLALTTCRKEDAERIAQCLVEKRLCACVNIILKMVSIYHWKGQIEREDEALLLMKTVESKKEDLLSALKEIHPYEVPEFIVLPIKWGSQDYLDWISRNTNP